MASNNHPGATSAWPPRKTILDPRHGYIKCPRCYGCITYENYGHKPNGKVIYYCESCPHILNKEDIQKIVKNAGNACPSCYGGMLKVCYDGAFLGCSNYSRLTCCTKILTTDIKPPLTDEKVDADDAAKDAAKVAKKAAKDAAKDAAKKAASIENLYVCSFELCIKKRGGKGVYTTFRESNFKRHLNQTTCNHIPYMTNEFSKTCCRKI